MSIRFACLLGFVVLLATIAVPADRSFAQARSAQSLEEARNRMVNEEVIGAELPTCASSSRCVRRRGICLCRTIKSRLHITTCRCRSGA